MTRSRVRLHTSRLHVCLLIYTDYFIDVLWITVNNIIGPSSKDIKK